MFKRILPHIVAIVVFLIVTVVYFGPLIEGKTLSQADVTHYLGASEELKEYYEKEGGSSAWTGAMFSGMPSYQIGVWSSVPNFLNYIEVPMRALDSSSAGAVFTAMLCAYILFIVMGFSPVVSIFGAIAYSMSSYNIIILEAGHVTKAWALAYLPLIVGSMMVMFKRKYLLGGLLMALGLALQIKNNHLQVTYYTGLLCVFIYLALVIQSISKKNVAGLLKASGILVVAVAIAVMCNMGSFYSNYIMSKESTRGLSELSAPTDSEKKSSGLDKDYAFAWSYGKAETLTLLIPDTYGGASGGRLGTSSHLYKELVTKGAQVEVGGVRSYTYWGDQPFTSGPVYFGAIVCFLFLLGMIIIRDNIKWFLLAATLFFVFLSWGKNFDGFNDFMFYHFPFYSKFRTVSMALVIPSLTMVIIAVWGLRDFFGGKLPKEKLLKALYISAGVTGGLCLFFWLMPGFFFNFTSDLDAAWRAQVPDWYFNALLLDRKDLLSADALRSLIFILLAAAILWVCLRNGKTDVKKLAMYGSVGVVLLVLIDLWTVDKRYLNDSNFVTAAVTQAQFTPSVADKAILQDKGPSHRVLNLNNTFQDSKTSYFHKSIGGYHAAKLKRYQELIDYHLTKEIQNIINSFSTQNIDSITAAFASNNALNMLNAKYVVFHPEQEPLVNPYAMGNAWFVTDYRMVDNADAEIAAINDFDPHRSAIVDKRFAAELNGLTIRPDTAAMIEMTEYKPDRVEYRSKNAGEQLAVFSEIYFADGWQAYIDGSQVPHFRADWTLRALRIPNGEHQIEFKFEPHEYYTCRTISAVSSGFLLVVLIVSLVIACIRQKNGLNIE